MPACLSAPFPGPSVPFPNDTNWNITEFHTTPVMSTYLLAYIVSEFTYVEPETPNNVLVRSCASLPFPSLGFAGGIVLCLLIPVPAADCWASV